MWALLILCCLLIEIMFSLVNILKKKCRKQNNVWFIKNNGRNSNSTTFRFAENWELGRTVAEKNSPLLTNRLAGVWQIKASRALGGIYMNISLEDGKMMDGKQQIFWCYKFHEKAVTFKYCCCYKLYISLKCVYLKCDLIFIVLGWELYCLH